MIEDWAEYQAKLLFRKHVDPEWMRAGQMFYITDIPSPQIVIAAAELRIEGKVAYLDSLVVSVSYRGQGLGKKLIDARLEAARDEGCIVAEAWCWDNPDEAARSLPLYEKLGFTKILECHPYEGHPCNHCGESCQCKATIVRKLL